MSGTNNINVSRHNPLFWLFFSLKLATCFLFMQTNMTSKYSELILEKNIFITF